MCELRGEMMDGFSTFTMTRGEDLSYFLLVLMME